MGRLLVPLLVAAFALPAGPDSQLDGAVHALRKDSSLKVRAQAAIVLGQRGATEAVPPLCDALRKDDAVAVRLAAAAALAKIGDPSARPVLLDASRSDPDAAVRAAAARAVEALVLSFTIEEAGGAGGAGERAALREAITRHLRDRGFAVIATGGMRLKPSVIRFDVDARGGRTVIAVKAALVAVDAAGRMAAMLEGGARLSAAGTIPERKLAAYSEKALDAAARTLCEDLAAKLAER